jgi:hypothetical protein
MKREKLILEIPVQIKYTAGWRKPAIKMVLDDIRDYSHLEGGIAGEDMSVKINGKMKVRKA